MRGATKQKAKTRQKLFDGSAFIQKEIEEIDKTSARGKYGKRKRTVRDDEIVIPEPIAVKSDDDDEEEMERLDMALTDLEKTNE